MVVSSYENIEETAVRPQGKRGLDSTYISGGDEVIPDMRRDIPVGYVEETVQMTGYGIIHRCTDLQCWQR